MTPHDAPELSQATVPDLAAIRARAAARSPEWHALRQTQLDSSEVALATMALGEEYLARGDLDTARSWFEMAAIHQAPDAHARLATVAVLIDAVRDTDIVSAAEGTELAVEQHDPHQDRDNAVAQLEATADLIRAAEKRAAHIVADAKDRAEQILAAARTEAKAVADTGRDHLPADIMLLPGHIDLEARFGSHGRPTVIQYKNMSDVDVSVVVPALCEGEPLRRDDVHRLRTALTIRYGNAAQGRDIAVTKHVKIWDATRPARTAWRPGTVPCSVEWLSRFASGLHEEHRHHFHELVMRLLALREELATATENPTWETVAHQLPGGFPLGYLWLPQSSAGGEPATGDQPGTEHRTPAAC